jgi:Flp pilus assembly protein TadG
MLKWFRRRIFRERDGQAVVETALVMPVFILLTFGLFECGMALMSYVNATYAIRMGARYASVHSQTSLSPATTAQIQNIVTSNMYFANSTFSTVIVSYGDRSGNQGGNYVGDLVGIGYLWSQNLNIPFYGKSNFYVSTQTYRMIIQ